MAGRVRDTQAHIKVLKPDSCWNACIPQLMTSRSNMNMRVSYVGVMCYLLTARRFTGFKNVIPMRCMNVVELAISTFLLTAA